MHHADSNPLTHDHNFLSASHNAHERRTRYVVVLTAAMMVVEIVAGLWTGSMALLADGIHMATHAGALGVAAFAYWFARRHADNPRFTFGTGKVGDLAGFASALVLAILRSGSRWNRLSVSSVRLRSPIPRRSGLPLSDSS